MIEICYVEDDENIGRVVQSWLEGRGCRVKLFSAIAEARSALENRAPDLLLVDWSMPDGRGDALCRWVRSRWRELPVICLTGRGAARAATAGTGSCAEDYVVKPFELDVLYSRMTALLRRAGERAGKHLSCGGIRVDVRRMKVYCGQEEVALGQTEYRLLVLLLKNKGRTVTREQLLKKLWDAAGGYVHDNTLSVTVKRLREKLHQPSCLMTVRSEGYRMEDGDCEEIPACPDPVQRWTGFPLIS